MKIRRLNRWLVTYKQARAIQERLRPRLILRGGPRAIKTIAGADVSYEKADNRFYAAVVVMEFPQLSIIEQVTASGVATFPYIPGMLTFREGPILIEAFRKLRIMPDLVIFDGQGVAHPRGFGLAAHMGLLLDVPSIGCAKSLLVGEFDEPNRAAGSASKMMFGGRIVGLALRTRTGVKPVYVSVGHRISLKAAAAWVLKSCRGYRIPEPTRQAHMLVNKLRLQVKQARNSKPETGEIRNRKQ